MAGVDRQARLAADPVGFVHRFVRADDREIVGLVASSLAFGNVVAVRASVGRVLDAMGPCPGRVRASALERPMACFVHRVYRGEHVVRMLEGAERLRDRHGSLGAAYAADFAATDGDTREALARFADALRGPAADRGMRHLVPDPRAGSACKRLLLYLRWMVRPDDGVDLGLWPVPAASLVIPVDTHVHRIARNLGLTQRADASWRTAEEITAALRAFDPLDPVKYDFAICHLGVSRACPSRREPAKCDACVMRDVCVVWTRATGAGRAAGVAPRGGARRATSPARRA